MSGTLDARLIAAHEAGDADALITLYIRAAEDTAEDDAAGFFLTHAYVFALEAGDARARDLRQRLQDMGRV